MTRTTPWQVGQGEDSLTGVGGDDFLQGGNGDDTLTGGSGNDTLTGGLNSDTFVFDVGSGLDIITDFKAGAGTDDVIRFSTAGASSRALLPYRPPPCSPVPAWSSQRARATRSRSRTSPSRVITWMTSGSFDSPAAILVTTAGGRSPPAHASRKRSFLERPESGVRRSTATRGGTRYRRRFRLVIVRFTTCRMPPLEAGRGSEPELLAGEPPAGAKHETSLSGSAVCRRRAGVRRRSPAWSDRLFACSSVRRAWRGRVRSDPHRRAWLEFS